MILYLPKCPRKPKIHSKFVLASYMGRKSIFFKYLICFYWKIFSHSMGNLFSLLLHSKNSYKCQALYTNHKDETLAPYTTLIIANFSKKLEKIVFLFPAI